MRSSVSIFFFFLFAVISKAQGQEHFEIFEESGKYGLKDLDLEILKPKYDSIFIHVDTLRSGIVITAYKGRKMFYFDEEGNKIYKGRANGSEPFQHGIGISQRRNGSYDLVRMDGSFLIKKTDLFSTPERYGQYVLVEKKEKIARNEFASNKTLFNPDGLVQENIDQIKTHEHYLFAGDQPRYRAYYDVYDQQTAVRLADSVLSFDDTLDHLFLKRADETTTLVDKTEGHITSGLRNITLINDRYFQDSKNGRKTLYEWEGQTPLISTACDSFSFKKKTIYAMGALTESGDQQLEIYDYDGQVLQQNLLLVYTLGDDRFVFGKEGREYIGNEMGNALSETFLQISPIAINGYRQVFEKYRYTYLNDSNYRTLSVDFPIIFQSKNSSTGDFFSAIAQVFVAIITLPAIVLLAPLTGGKSFEILNQLSPAEQQRYDVASPTDSEFFVEGRAIVCTYGMKNDSSMVLAPDYLLTYNYVDTAGEFLNEKEYETCYPFNSGVTWVEEDDTFYQIDTTGKKVGRYTFDDVERDENGFYICSNAFTSSFFIFSSTYNQYKLFSPEGKLLHKRHFEFIKLKEGSYYGVRDDREYLLFALPEAQDTQ